MYISSVSNTCIHISFKYMYYSINIQMSHTKQYYLLKSAPIPMPCLNIKMHKYNDPDVESSLSYAVLDYLESHIIHRTGT